MNIPQELLKLTDKELHKLLDINPYGAKYIYQEPNTIYKVEKRLANKGIVRSLNDNTVQIVRGIKGSYLPVTYKDVQDYKKERILKVLNTCSNNTFVKYLDTLVNAIFHKEQYDITSEERWIDLVIYYPEIIITNSHELSHVMKDIYIKFSFYTENNLRKLINIDIARTTYFDYEYQNNYVFSHVDFNSLTKYSSNLCFGQTDLSQIVSNLKKGNFSKLQQVLLSFKDYLSWESIEGTPYKYISELHNKTDKYAVDTSYFSFIKLEDSYKKVINNIEDLKYTYDLVDGKYKIKLNKDSIDYIEEYLTITESSNNLFYLIDNKSYSYNSLYKSIDMTTLNRSTEIVFKGEEKLLNIINTSNEDTVEPPKRIHRSILNCVITKLEEKFNQYLINQKLEEVYG